MKLISYLFIIFFAPLSAFSQTFSAGNDGTSFSATDSGSYFVLEKPAQKLNFVFVPPAQKLFVDLTGDKVLFPALFPITSFFNVVKNPPPFFADRFKGAFAVYEIGDHYLGLDAAYSLYSATIKGDKLFILARDQDGDFVALDPSHFAIYLKNGSPKSATELKNENRNVSVLVDRSASMDGFDTDVSAAIKELSLTLVKDDFCALYEFGHNSQVIHSPNKVTCQSVFTRYRMSRANGGTPLFATLERSYQDIQKSDVLSAIVIISDGAPSDRPSQELHKMSKETPTFVIWVGNHTTDYLASFSTAHAISKSGVEAAVRDFLRGISFSVKGHQTFKLSAP